MNALNVLMNYRPPVNFYFAVNILDPIVGAAINVDAAFQEVSGISAEQQFDEIKEGGENRFAYQVPGRVKYENLTLKRGLVVWPSPLGIWCRYRLSSGINTLSDSNKLKPRDIMVQLLDANTKLPIMAWFFAKAQPVKWQIDPLNAQDSKISVESLTFNYQYFQTMEGIGSTYLMSDLL